MAVLFLGIISPKQIKAQDPMCATLRTQLDAAEKLSAQISGRKTATDDFINSVYEPVNDAIIDDEIELSSTLLVVCVWQVATPLLSAAVTIQIKRLDVSLFELITVNHVGPPGIGGCATDTVSPAICNFASLCFCLNVL